MKKILSILLAIALLCACAYAFEGKNYPAYDGASLPDNAAGGSYGGDSLLLEFDPQYSLAENGIMQACFFAYDESQQNFLELYLTLPASAAPGDVITESTPVETGCSVTMYEVLPASETCYFASQFLGVAYPVGSSFEISIAEAETSAEGFHMRGTLSASLCRMQGDFPTQDMLSLSAVEFDFTLPTASGPSFGNPLPETTPETAPKFTLPPNYAVI